MKSRLHKIEIRNFKAFRQFTLNLEDRHLLVYGDNGAGKSSLYRALHTFLQSARKSKDSIAKYFDPDGPVNLLNIHEKDPAGKPDEIAVTLREVVTKTRPASSGSCARHWRSSRAKRKSHVPADDGPGRIMGSPCGIAAFELASKYHDGSILTEPVDLAISLDGENGEITLRWTTVRGTTSSIQESSDLKTFEDVMTMDAASDIAEATVSANGESVRFFRVVRLPGLNQ